MALATGQVAPGACLEEELVEASPLPMEQHSLGSTLRGMWVTFVQAQGNLEHRLTGHSRLGLETQAWLWLWLHSLQIFLQPWSFHLCLILSRCQTLWVSLCLYPCLYPCLCQHSAVVVPTRLHLYWPWVLHSSCFGVFAFPV